MRDRATPRDIPSRAPYVVVELPGREPHDLRIPSLMAVSKIVQRLDSLHIAAIMGLRGDADNTHAVIGIMREVGPELAALLGALIGHSWCHRTLDLETESHSDPLVYGEAVYEELHSAGYSFEHLLLLGLTIVRALWDQSQLSAEVSKRAAFFSPLLARSNSSDSISGSIT